MRGFTKEKHTILLSRFVLFSALLSTPWVSASAESLGGLLRVGVVSVKEAAVPERRNTTGLVRAWRTATIAAEGPGRVIKRHVEPGYFAQQGEILVQTDPRRVDAILRQARATLATHRVNVADAEQDLERTQKLFNRGAISQDTVDDRSFDLERAQAQLELAEAAVQDSERQAADVAIQAPFSGKVEAVYVQEGDYVNIGTPVAMLSDFSRARVITGVSSTDIGRIASGETAIVTLFDLGGLSLRAEVTSVGSIKEARSGTFPVELIIDGEGVADLKDGLVATVAWEASQDTAALTIPTSAILRRDGRLVVYTVNNGIASEKTVTTGRSSGEHIVVHTGLKLGEQVVVDGHFALRDGARVEVKSKGMTGANK